MSDGRIYGVLVMNRKTSAYVLRMVRYMARTSRWTHVEGRRI